jgi:hypothetical protein
MDADVGRRVVARGSAGTFDAFRRDERIGAVDAVNARTV